MGFINVSVEVIFVQFLPKVAAEDKRKFGLWWTYFFLSAIWLPRGKFWVTDVEAASLTWC